MADKRPLPRGQAVARIAVRRAEPAPPSAEPMPMPDARTPLRNEAVALAYTAGEAAPRVVAKGKGVVAREIIERAHEAGVFVHESPELVSLLMQVDLDAPIPPQLFVPVPPLPPI